MGVRPGRGLVGALSFAHFAGRRRSSRMTMSQNPNLRMERLIADEWPKLRRFFRTKVVASDVLDLAQASILALVESGGPCDPEKLKPFLWGIARNQLLKHYDKHRRETQPFDSEVHSALEVGASLSSKLDRRNRVVAALLKLPVNQQIAVELRHGEELPLEDVATSLGVSLATVKRYLAVAEETLRADLGDLARVGSAYRNL
jgi:RNA polymerase sigma factor (sigma-70 family)